MFEVGDFIVYGQNGICKVTEITQLEESGVDKNRLYYVLVPEKTRDSRLFCPADSDRIIIRKVISAEEAKQIMEESKSIEPLEIPNERARDGSYKMAMKSCDLRQSVSVLKTLLIRKKEREENGKKITTTDERYLKQAEEGLFSELAMATGMTKEKVKEIMLDICG